MNCPCAPPSEEPWNEALACPLEQRVANLRDPNVRRKLQADVEVLQGGKVRRGDSVRLE
jgi:hypothetical protein